MSGFMDDKNKLNYLLSEKKGILVITLIGPLVRENSETFDECIKELSQITAGWVVINFRDVPNVIDKTFMVPAVARLQKRIRDKRAELKLSGLHPAMKAVLLDNGVLRQEEVCDNLAEALKSLSFNIKAA